MKRTWQSKGSRHLHNQQLKVLHISLWPFGAGGDGCEKSEGHTTLTKMVVKLDPYKRANIHGAWSSTLQLLR